jgi:Atypical PilZ domain, cyclic di-GMP receptor
MNELGNSENQGLIYEDMLPIRWLPMDGKTLALDLAKLDIKNEEFLRFIEVLDEHPNESSVEHSNINQELAKIEVKFDLLLNLVSKLLGVYFPLPSPVHVKVTPSGIQWITSEAINPGEHGHVEIYMSSRCPRALVFPARVDLNEIEGEAYRVTAQFCEMSGTTRERLEKLIFRHHRRGVALARRR